MIPAILQAATRDVVLAQVSMRWSLVMAALMLLP